MKTAFEDAREGRCEHKFECWGWGRVGANYELKQILMTIISQVVVHGHIYLEEDQLLTNMSEEELSKYFLHYALET